MEGFCLLLSLCLPLGSDDFAEREAATANVGQILTPKQIRCCKHYFTDPEIRSRLVLAHRISVAKYGNSNDWDVELVWIVGESYSTMFRIAMYQMVYFAEYRHTLKASKDGFREGDVLVYVEGEYAGHMYFAFADLVATVRHVVAQAWR